MFLPIKKTIVKVFNLLSVALGWSVSLYGWYNDLLVPSPLGPYTMNTIILFIYLTTTSFTACFSFF